MASKVPNLAPFNNGIQRYLNQLKRLTFQYCHWGGSSKGFRNYIDSDISKLAEQNPQISFYVRHRPYRHPRIVAEYLNNNTKIVCVKNLTVKEIQTHVELLRSSSGLKQIKLKKPWQTNNPTIQGNWTPFLNK